MDIILRRCSPPTKQLAHRSRTNIVAAPETSTRPTEAALEPDSSPHDAAPDGEAKSGTAGSALMGAAMEPEQPQQQRHVENHNDGVDGEVGPGESLLASTQPTLEWLLHHPDARNVSRIQEELILHQHWQRIPSARITTLDANECGGDTLPAKAQAGPLGELALNQQERHGAGLQDELSTRGPRNMELAVMAATRPDPPQPPSMAEQLSPLPDTKQDGSIRDPSPASLCTADGREFLAQQQLEPGVMSGGNRGNGRAKFYSRERSGEQRSSGQADGRGAGLARRGRKSTEEELFQAADALELLMNSEPGEGGGMGKAGGPGAAALGGAGLNGGIGRIVASSRAGGGAGPSAAGTRGEPLAPGGGTAWRGRFGNGGRRGGGGRGMRIGGTGPRIIRGAVPDADVEDDVIDNDGVDVEVRQLVGAREARLDTGDTPSRGPLRGARGRLGAGRYGSTENDEGAEWESLPAGSLRRNGTYDGDARTGAGFGVSGDFHGDQNMFGPVPRRPRTSVYCSPLLYDEIISGVHPPASEVQVLAMSWSEFVRMVHLQRVREQQQARLMAGWHPAAAAAAAAAQLQGPHLHLQQQRAAQQVPFPVNPLHPAAVLGSPGSLPPQAFSQELLRRALLIQQEHMQQGRIPDWDAHDDDRYGNTADAGAALPAPGRRSVHTTLGPPRNPRASAAAAGTWPKASELPRHGDANMSEDIERQRVLQAQQPYGELLNDATVAAMATAAAQQQRFLEHLAMLGFGVTEDGIPDALGMALGRAEQMFGYSDGGSIFHPDAQHDLGMPQPDLLSADVSREAPAGQRRRARPGKSRHIPDLPPLAGDLPPYRDDVGGGSGHGSKRAWSPRDDPILANVTYVGPPPTAPTYGIGVLDEEDPGAAGQTQDGPQRPRRGPPRDTSADVAPQPGGQNAGVRGSGGGAHVPTGAGGVTGTIRQRCSSSRSRRGSLGNAPDSDVEEAPPSTEGDAGDAGWRRSSRGGGGSGDADDVDGGMYGPYGGPATGQEPFYSSFDRPDSPGDDGGVAVADPPVSKRQRQADVTLPNGRSGGTTGYRGRGRNTSLSGGGVPVLDLGLTMKLVKGGVGAGTAEEQQRLLELTYKPYVELRDVQEEKDGQQLSLVLTHSTLGIFAGNLTLVTAE